MAILTTATTRLAAALAERLAGEVIAPDHTGYDARPPRLERHDRQAPGRDRALRATPTTWRPPSASPPSTGSRSPSAAAATTSPAPPSSTTAS